MSVIKLAVLTKSLPRCFHIGSVCKDVQESSTAIKKNNPPTKLFVSVCMDMELQGKLHLVQITQMILT